MSQDIGSLPPLTTVEQPDEPLWGKIAFAPQEQAKGLPTPVRDRCCGEYLTAPNRDFSCSWPGLRWKARGPESSDADQGIEQRPVAIGASTVTDDSTRNGTSLLAPCTAEWSMREPDSVVRRTADGTELVTFQSLRSEADGPALWRLQALRQAVGEISRRLRD